MQTDPSFELPELPPLPELAAIESSKAKSSSDDREPITFLEGRNLWVPVVIGKISGHYCPQLHKVATVFDVSIDADGAKTAFATGFVRVMTPTAFECLGGKENNRKWRLSIRVLLPDGNRGIVLGKWLKGKQLEKVGPSPPVPSAKKRKMSSEDQSSGDPDYSSSQDTGSGPSSGKRPLKHASGPQGGRLSKMHRPTIYEPQIQDEFNEFDPADLIGNFMSHHLMSEFCGAPPAPSIPPATAQPNRSLLAEAAHYSLQSVFQHSLAGSPLAAAAGAALAAGAVGVELAPMHRIPVMEVPAGDPALTASPFPFLSAPPQQTPPLTLMAAGHGLVPAPGHLVVVKDFVDDQSEPDIDLNEIFAYRATPHGWLVADPELVAKMGLSVEKVRGEDISPFPTSRPTQRLDIAPLPPPSMLEVRPAGCAPVKLQGLSPGLQIGMNQGIKYDMCISSLKTPQQGCGASLAVYHVQVQTSPGSEGGSDSAACAGLEYQP